MPNTSQLPKARSPLETEVADFPSVAAVRAHLAQILASPPFESSRRSREMLSHLVEKTLAGHPDELKERAIGEDVFSRAGYEPSEQNLVRVAANELRKRLAQFYDQQPDSPVRIELPRGAYIPAFHLHPLRTIGPPLAGPAPATPDPPVSESRPVGTVLSKRWMTLMTVVLAGVTVAGWLWRSRPSPEEAFWRPVLATGKPAVIWAQGRGAVMPYETWAKIAAHENDTGPYTLELLPGDVIAVDQVMAYGHVYGIATLSSWLAKHGQAPELRLGFGYTPAELGGRPLILFGALNNPWTIDLTKDLRFRVVNDTPGGAITDRTDPSRRWSIPGYRKRGFDIQMDYALITRTLDIHSGEVRIAIAGLAHYSSQSAAEFLTEPKFWNSINQVAPKGWEQMNLQIVLQVQVTEKVPGSPKLVAWHFW